MPLHMRLPKRGFHHTKRRPFAIINIEMLDKHFAAGDEVTTAVLLQRHLVADLAGGVKVLGKGEITKALKLAVEAISPGAQAKIEAAGGSVVVLGVAHNVSSSEAAPKE
jgi:large subunit ribosomal protein L15